MEAPKKVRDLVERFQHNYEHYMRSDYKETRLRVEFIDPFFEALGWDVRNVEGAKELSKDVVHEDAISVSGKTRAPDYCFRVGGERKFFLEAKKPSVSLKNSVESAFQLRRYSWSAKLPIGILTDFEELAIYDCRRCPRGSDRASVGRISYFSFEEYLTRYGELHSLFSKKAVLAGSLDKYAKTLKDTRGSNEVDAELLKDIEQWRDSLARNIAIRNTHLSAHELNYCVQKTIDRIIFLRMAEDRGIEPYGSLIDICKASNIYSCLCDLYSEADDKYNSGLFDFKADTITIGLIIDDKVLKPILTSLYYPISPYEFSILPLEILGQVYEQFLGKVIRLTPNHRAKVEEKPEVKKAGGVYYTPRYIVDYIVSQTITKQVEGKTPRQISKLRFLDPACGSGSFLLGIYGYLLNYHIEWYKFKDIEKYSLASDSPIYFGGGGEWKLTTSEKKRILLNNIYGVDIDQQAVEVTKLSLLLKVLEGESEETLGQQLSLWQERALPDLGSNIKCGNSIIEPDFFSGQLLLDEDRLRRTNPFDWRNEFSQIIKQGGFNAVVGNPPYVDSEWMTKHFPDWRKYCVSKYTSASGNWDIFCIFVEKALDLCCSGGLSSLILPNKLGSTNYSVGAREVLTQQNCLQHVRDYSSVSVFPVAVYPIVYVAQKKDKSFRKNNVGYERMSVNEDGLVVITEEHSLDYNRYFGNSEKPWPIFSGIQADSPAERISDDFPRLDSIAKVRGAATVAEAYEMRDLISSNENYEADSLKIINSGTIDRYDALWGRKKLRYLKNSYEYPVIQPNSQFKLPQRRKEQAETPKIVVAGMTKVLECVLDEVGEFLAAKSTTIIMSDYDLYYLLGILNSSLMSYYYQYTFGGDSLQGGYLRIGPPQLRTLPIRTINKSKREDIAFAEEVSKLVKLLIQLYKQYASVKLTSDKNLYMRRILDIENRLNKMVYKLYNLSEEEIRVVDESFSEQ